MAIILVKEQGFEKVCVSEEMPVSKKICFVVTENAVDITLPEMKMPGNYLCHGKEWFLYDVTDMQNPKPIAIPNGWHKDLYLTEGEQIWDSKGERIKEELCQQQ